MFLLIFTETSPLKFKHVVLMTNTHILCANKLLLIKIGFMCTFFDKYLKTPLKSTLLVIIINLPFTIPSHDIPNCCKKLFSRHLADIACFKLSAQTPDCDITLCRQLFLSECRMASSVPSHYIPHCREPSYDIPTLGTFLL